jgi:hypothetical protein
MKQILKILFGLCAVVGLTNAVDTESPICNCQTCCNVANETNTHFTGKTIVEFTYPDVSYSGKYTVVAHVYDNGARLLEEGRRDLAIVNDTYPYQYVVKYENAFKTTFDRNVLIFSNVANNLNCTESHLYYGSPDDETFKKIDMVAITKDGGEYCTLDINYQLTRDEIAAPGEIYFAFDKLVDEKAEFYIMYDMSDEGLIVPEDDIKDYPYIVSHAAATDVDVDSGVLDYYIDVHLNATDIQVALDGENTGENCLTLDQLVHANNSYWWVDDTGLNNCPVEILTAGTGDAVAHGREYHIKIPQNKYEECSYLTAVDGDNLVFHFRLVLPRDGTETAGGPGDLDTDNCYYFNENLNVQNFTVTMAAEVEGTVSSNFDFFAPRLISVTPERCPVENYPIPYSKINIVINATVPVGLSGDALLSFPALPTLDGEAASLQWEGGGLPNYDCGTEVITTTAGDYKECTFRYESTVCEPTYVTLDGECAFERNTTRLIEGFTVKQTFDSGLYSTYIAEPINTGLDNSEYMLSLCDPVPERAVVDVTDMFEVDLSLRNYFQGEGVDWANTTNPSFNDNIIVRMRVGQTADSPWAFTGLDLVMKTVTVTLKNPNNDNVITTYSFASSEKADFMSYSWTPYYKNPLFCRWYDAADVTERCGEFFVNPDRWNTWHTNSYGSAMINQACQLTDTFEGANVDNANSDFFIFEPKTWFRDYTEAYIKVEVTVSAVVHQCGGAARRMLLADSGSSSLRTLQGAPDPDSEVIFVKQSLSVLFNDLDGDGDLDMEFEDSSVLSDPNQMWVYIVLGFVVFSVLVGVVIVMSQRHNHYTGVISNGYDTTPRVTMAANIHRF